MNENEIAGELAQAGAQELLADARLARVAYNGVDGAPMVIPIGFHWNGTAIVVCTATTAPKVRALGADPRVAVSIDTGSTPWEARSLLVRGTAELETVDGIPEEYIAASAKSLDADAVREFERAVATMYEQMVRITIEPRWARFYDFGAGRVPAFLGRLAEGS
jgi:nitroimidazol reductase NimA-like FMN-containing flavoprotein (pyridoxamine 5'-phosphate oxidase superfamily)